MAEVTYTADEVDASTDKTVDWAINLYDAKGRKDKVDPAGTSFTFSHTFAVEPTFTELADKSGFSVKFPVDANNAAMEGTANVDGVVKASGEDETFLVNAKMNVTVDSTVAEVVPGPLH